MADSNIPSFQKAIDIISDAFSILDFSYFISGSVAYAMIYIRLKYSSFAFDMLPNNLWVVIALSLIAIYVLGIFTSSLGHIIRKLLFGMFDIKLDNSNEETCCVKENIRNWLWKFQKYVWVTTSYELRKSIELFNSLSHGTKCTGISVDVNDNNSSIIYTYIWNALSASQNANDRIKFINRFWVMQKVYEGLMTDCVLCVVLIAFYEPYKNHQLLCPEWYIYLISFICFMTFAYEAALNFKTQVREAVMAYYTFSNDAKNEPKEERTEKEAKEYKVSVFSQCNCCKKYWAHNAVPTSHPSSSSDNGRLWGL